MWIDFFAVTSWRLFRLVVVLPAALVAALVVLSSSSAAQESAAQEGNAARRAQQENEALARIGDELLTVVEFEAELGRLRARAPGAAATLAEQRELLDEMVRRRSLLARAEAAGYAEHPAVVEVWRQMMITTYLRETLDERLRAIEVDDAEVAEHYAANADRYAVPARSQVAIVVYAASPHAEAARRADLETKALEARAEAAALAPSIRHFGEIARRDSEDRASRYRGGVVGWIPHLPEPQSSLPPAVVEAALALETPGQIAPLVEAEDGFYLVRLVDRDEGRMQPLEQVAAGIRHQLLQSRRDAMREAYDAETRAALGVEIDEELFESLDFGTTPPAVPSRPGLAAAAEGSATERPGTERPGTERPGTERSGDPR